MGLLIFCQTKILLAFEITDGHIQASRVENFVGEHCDRMRLGFRGMPGGGSGLLYSAKRSDATGLSIGFIATGS
jgi:hypothetical protein